jgi:hypothetical protein
MSGTAGRLVIGFIAAALAVVTAHQGVVYVLNMIGWTPNKPWSTAAFGPWGVPQIVNSMFWGGLWGALYGLIHEKIPGGAAAVKGLLYGLAIVVCSNWIVLPLIRGQALFAGMDSKRLMAGALILGGFGIGTALFYQMLRRD